MATRAQGRDGGGRGWPSCAARSGTPATTATPTSTGRGCAAACPADALRRPAADRHRQHRLGPDAVQRAPDRGRRVGARRRLRGRRHPAGPAGGVARRDAGPADGDALAQHGRDGHRGDAPGQPDRRRRAARRLRQDDPVAAHGRRVGRPAGRRRPRRPDAHRHLPRRAARLRHRRVAAVGGGPRRHALRRRQFPGRSRR